jgi:nuclear transcription factor Y gamma
MNPQDQNSGQHNQHGQQARQMPAYDLSLGGHYGASAAVCNPSPCLCSPSTQP